MISHMHTYIPLLSQNMLDTSSLVTLDFFISGEKSNAFPTQWSHDYCFNYLHANSSYILIVFLDVSHSEKSSLAHFGTHQSKVDPLCFYVCPISNITLQFPPAYYHN